MEGFDLYLFSFGLLSFDLCSLLGRVLIICELLLGLGLLSGLWRRFVNISTAAMLLGLSAFLLWRLLLGDRESCHCFGPLLDLNPGQSLVKNLLLALMLAISWKAPGFAFLNSRPRLMPVLAALIGLALASMVFALRPPSLWYRLGAKNKGELVENLWAPNAEELGLDQGRQLLVFLSPLCEHCQHCISKLTTIVSRHGLDTENIHLVFMVVAQNEEENPLLLPYFFEQAGVGDPHYDTVHLPAAEFISITNGVMPLVCLFEDGELLAEYGYNNLDENALAAFLALGDQTHEQGGAQQQEE